jgi:hypothetical protein
MLWLSFKAWDLMHVPQAAEFQNSAYFSHNIFM